MVYAFYVWGVPFTFTQQYGIKGLRVFHSHLLDIKESKGLSQQLHLTDFIIQSLVSLFFLYLPYLFISLLTCIHTLSYDASHQFYYFTHPPKFYNKQFLCLLCIHIPFIQLFSPFTFIHLMQPKPLSQHCLSYPFPKSAPPHIPLDGCLHCHIPVLPAPSTFLTVIFCSISSLFISFLHQTVVSNPYIMLGTATPFHSSLITFFISHCFCISGLTCHYTYYWAAVSEPCVNQVPCTVLQCLARLASPPTGQPVLIPSCLVPSYPLLSNQMPSVCTPLRFSYLMASQCCA